MGGQSFRRNFQRCRAQATASTESYFSGFDPHTKQLGSLSATNSADALFLRDDHDEEGNVLANRRRDGGSKGGDTGARAGRQT